MRQWQDLYRHRALAEILVQRELKARYRGTALGFCWSFVNPLMMMSIYVLVFHYALRVPMPNYGAFILAGLLPWNAFTSGVLEGAGSLLDNGNLIKKVSLPAEVFPLTCVLSNLVHLALSLPVLALVIWGSGVPLGFASLWAPAILMVQGLYTFAFALLLSSFTVQFRDLRHILPNILMMWFYITPVIYESSMMPAAFRRYMVLNPLAPLVESFRNAVLHNRMPHVGWLALQAVVGVAFMAATLALFRYRRPLYAELV